MKKKPRAENPKPEHDETERERIERLTKVGAYGALAPQFFRQEPSDTSDFRDKILNGDYFKQTDE